MYLSKSCLANALAYLNPALDGILSYSISDHLFLLISPSTMHIRFLKRDSSFLYCLELIFKALRVLVANLLVSNDDAFSDFNHLASNDGTLLFMSSLNCFFIKANISFSNGVPSNAYKSSHLPYSGINIIFLLITSGLVLAKCFNITLNILLSPCPPRISLI